MGILISDEENEKILTDKDGYLVHLSDWHEKVATKMAKKEALIKGDVALLKVLSKKKIKE